MTRLRAVNGRTTHLGALCSGLILSASACSDQTTPTPPDDRGRDGVIVFDEADPEHGVRGSYPTRDHHLIYFEALRGPPADTRIDEHAPDFEVDVRILSKDLEPFSMQVGGHSPMDSTWVDDALADYPIDGDARRDHGARDDRRARARRREGRVVQHLDRRLRAHVRDPQEGQTVSEVVTCNHGTCAGAMTTVSAGCPKSYSGRPKALPLLSAVCMTSIWEDENYSTPGCCASPYGVMNGKHVCNDDSIVQRNRMKTATGASVSTAVCTDTVIEKYAPTCN